MTNAPTFAAFETVDFEELDASFDFWLQSFRPMRLPTSSAGATHVYRGCEWTDDGEEVGVFIRFSRRRNTETSLFTVHVNRFAL